MAEKGQRKLRVPGRSTGPVPAVLRRRWWAGAAAGVGGLLLSASLLTRAWGPAAGGRWLLLAGLVWLYLSWFLRRRLARNRHEGSGRVLDSWGPGTWLSLLRALAVSMLGGFLLQGRPAGLIAWLPMALYTLSDIADYFDGYLARRSGFETLLGRDLDLELDALGLLIAVALTVQYGTLPLLFLPIGLARYGFALLVGVRERLGLKVHELPPSLSRRPLAGMTMGFISAALWPIVRRPEATLAGLVFMLPFAAGFVRDGLVVSGALDPRGDGYTLVREKLRTWLLHYLPPLLRAVFAVAVVLEIRRLLAVPVEFSAGWRAWGFESPAQLALIFAAVQALAGLALLAGWAGRLAAFALIFPVGLTITATSLDPIRAVLLFAVLVLLLTGTGRFSLWRPTDIWFRRRAGEAPDMAQPLG